MHNARKSYILVIFRGGGGGGSPDPMFLLWIRARMVFFGKFLKQIFSAYLPIPFYNYIVLSLPVFVSYFVAVDVFCENARMNLRCSE